MTQLQERLADEPCTARAPSTASPATPQQQLSSGVGSEPQPADAAAGTAGSSLIGAAGLHEKSENDAAAPEQRMSSAQTSQDPASSDPLSSQGKQHPASMPAAGLRSDGQTAPSSQQSDLPPGSPLQPAVMRSHMSSSMQTPSSGHLLPKSLALPQSAASSVRPGSTVSSAAVTPAPGSVRHQVSIKLLLSCVYGGLFLDVSPF